MRPAIAIVLYVTGGCFGGSSDSKDAAADASVSLTDPLENGEACFGDTQCASGHCGQSVAGDRWCYGRGRANEPCSDTFDCDGGGCTPTTLAEWNAYGEDEPTSGVCTPGDAVCINIECTLAAISTCLWDRECGEEVRDLDRCIGSRCANFEVGPNPLSPRDCEALDFAIFTEVLSCP